MSEILTYTSIQRILNYYDRLRCAFSISGFFLEIPAVAEQMKETRFPIISSSSYS